GRTAANNDVNLIKEFERQPGPVQAIAYSPDGESIAVGGTSSEVRIYKLDGKRVATLKGHEGAIFSIVFHPAKKELVTGGYDGKVRLYESESGRLITTFLPVPITPVQQASLRK